MGPVRAHARARPAAVRPDLPPAGSGSSGRASRRSRPTAARCSSPTTPARSHRDAPAIMHGIETELQRPVYGLADHIFREVPVVGTLWSRVGGVVAHPDNAYRLLREQQQLVLVFPEGTKGTAQDLHASATGSAGSAVAASSRSPCGPACRSCRSRSSAPRSRCRSCSSSRSSPRRSACRTSRSPPTCWRSGRSASSAYFPAKFKLRVLDPVHFDVPPDQPRYSRSRIMDESESIREQIQDALYDMLRAVVRFGAGSADGSPRPRSPASARSGVAASRRPSRPTTTSTSSSASTRDEPTVELERTEYVRSDENYSILARIVKATKVDTIVHTFLVVDSTADAVADDARDQRHRHDEPLRGGVGAGQHRAQRRREVVDARLRQQRQRTRCGSARRRLAAHRRARRSSAAS